MNGRKHSTARVPPLLGKQPAAAQREGNPAKTKASDGGKRKKSALLVAQILQWVSGLPFLRDFCCLLILII